MSISKNFLAFRLTVWFLILSILPLSVVTVFVLDDEEYFRTLIENAHDIITILESDGTIRFKSPSVERVLGYKPEALLGQNVFDLIHPEDCAAVKEVFHQNLKIAGVTRRIEFRFRHCDGTWRYLEAVGQNLLFNPLVKGGVVNSRDITGRKELEEQFRQAQKMEAIGRLAGGVAHDFNNILTVITGYSELLLLDDVEAEQLQRQYIEEIRQASEQASALTGQLLAFSRQQVLQPERLVLNQIVIEMEKILRRLIGEDIEVVFTLSDDLGLVKADPGQIQQVILNLAVNGRDAMSRGGKLTIETVNVELDHNYASQHTEIAPGPFVMLAVSDTGRGMAAETRSRVFDPFFTTKESGKGTGLGLSTVHGIVKQSGGHIWVYSEPGQGTTFKIYLPRVADAAASAVGARMASLDLHTGSESILVAEDEPMVLELALRILSSHGYTVLTAVSGAEALRIAAQHQGPIHLLLTDVVMPGGTTGRQLADQLTSVRPETKIIYMSGYTDNAIVHHGVLESDLVFLQKPFTPQTLRVKVREALA